MVRAREKMEKMKRSVEELSESSSLIQLKRRRLVRSSSLDDHCLASCCTSNDSAGVSKQKLTITELQEVSSGGVKMAETATFNAEQTERNQTTAFSNLQEEETKLESTAAPPYTAEKSPEAKLPSDSELEEFFSAAEKTIQKQFSKKYNFDIVKEEALEGRFEWVRVKL